MSGEEDKTKSLGELDALSARWDKVSFRVQGSPFEDLSVSSLAKDVGNRVWSRPGGKVKGDTLTRYIYFSFEELLEVEKLDLKSATLLLEICESLFSMEEGYDGIGSFEEVAKQANQQRQRFFEEFGLYGDFPVALSNMDDDLRELCVSEGIVTFVDLMEFLDRLTDRAMIGGAYRSLQNVFAHGDEKGLSEYFPYRVGSRGFHLAETLSFLLNHLSEAEMQELTLYYEKRGKRKWLGDKKTEIPLFVGKRLLPEVFQCLCYFAKRDPELLLHLHDATYLTRELMFVNEPQREALLFWLVQLSLGIFRKEAFESDAVLYDDILAVRLPQEEDSIKELRSLLHGLNSSEA